MFDWFDKLGLIRVGPYRIIVHWMDKKEAKKWENPAGFFLPEQCQIALREDLDIDFLRETLLHEILHACALVAGVDDSDPDEERIVRALAPTLLDVLQRNPRLVRYLRLG